MRGVEEESELLSLFMSITGTKDGILLKEESVLIHFIVGGQCL